MAAGGKFGVVCMLFFLSLSGVFDSGSAECREAVFLEKGRHLPVVSCQGLLAEKTGRKETFLRESQEALRALDEQIEAFVRKMRDRWEQMEPRARKEAEALLDAMEKQRQLLAEKLEALEESSAAAWRELREEFEKALESLARSLDKEFSPPGPETVHYI
jgi:DNA anti-recombination protein RmuC